MRRQGWWLSFAVLTILGGLTQAGAAEVDVRQFRVLIDGKEAGNYRMTITRLEDGSLVETGAANVRVTVLGVTAYRYSYSGSETWKEGRLLRLESTSDDDGKRFTVSAAADGSGLRLRVNGAERSIAADCLTSSCWHLPDAGHRQGALRLLDVDTGSEFSGLIEYVGTAQVNVAGQVQDCTHYRVTGGMQLDLWYDAEERLVREESLEDGHPTVLECVGR